MNALTTAAVALLVGAIGYASYETNETTTLTLDLTLVGDVNGNVAATQQAQVRACVADGAAAVEGASVELTVSLQGPGASTVPLATNDGASGTTGADGCVTLLLPFDATGVNVPGKHRVDGAAGAGSSSASDFVQYTVTAR